MKDYLENTNDAVLEVTDLNLTDAYPDLIAALKQVTNSKPIILHQNGEQIAAVISTEDLRLFERLIEAEEDRIDTEESKKVLAEVKEQGTVSWQALQAKLGL